MESSQIAKPKPTSEDTYVSSASSLKKPQIRATSAPFRFPRLVDRKERWGLSWLGWIAVALVFVVVGYITILQTYPFLSITDRVDANILVMEGWVHPYAIRASIDEFKTGRYERIFTTGGPVVGVGGYINDASTAASVGAGGLRAAGIPPELIQMVPSQINDRDRTYSSAVALRRWLHDRDVKVKGINVVTENTHARRSWYLFQKAFGDDVTVGIIAARNPDYDPKHWWSCSEGVRDVIDEGIAYIYAKFFFYPSEASNQKTTAETSQATR